MVFPARLSVVLLCVVLAACGRGGDGPGFTPASRGDEYFAMSSSGLPDGGSASARGGPASLWNAGRESLLGDRRASQRGDILTVVIEIDDRAEMSNSSDRSRQGQGSVGLPSLLGIPQRAEGILPEGASLDPAIEYNSSGSYSGNGAIRRAERMTLRMAATIVEVLPNGVLRIEGSQQVRVNYELRELIMTGFARPEDISRQNEITYDKIAGARIFYGGRGMISGVQQPNYGQRAADTLAPF